MTAVSGNITAAGVSASFTPTNGVSDVMIKRNDSGGEIHVDAKDPTSGNWSMVAGGGSDPIVTADPAILYRFRVTGTSSDIDFDYYIGP
jgi:hypothetical protein